MITSFGDSLQLDLYLAADEPPRLCALRLNDTVLAEESAEPANRDVLPLVQIELAGQARQHTDGKRHTGSEVSARLRYTGHKILREPGRTRLEVASQDPVTGLSVSTSLEQCDGVDAVRAWSTVTAGAHEIVLLHVTSLLLPGVLPVGDARWEDRLSGWTAANPWCGEGRWSGATLAERGLIQSSRADARNRFALASTGSWSSADHLPMGGLVDEQSGRALLWQIEHNGSWSWEVGDRYDSLYLALSGPGDQESQWSKRLGPGESFSTVPVAIAGSVAGLEGAAGEMTEQRRRTRRPHEDNERLPIVFNDYMNCLSGDPSTERLLPLIDAAARAGAEYFCIDAGWYDDTDGWWDSVGAWQPSTVRFPGGLEKVMDRIRERGMVPGLWIEPEVVGVRSPKAAELPDEAFFSRYGRRLTARGRHQLDLRHPAAVAHLDEAVDRLIAQFGLGYLKFDYNIEIGPGTDHAADSAGDGLLGHNRAFLAWLNGVLDRHPGLVVENCSSGGLRTDHAMLSTAQVHSVTDQTDFRLLPAIAAAAPMAVTPEQSALWAYPGPDMSDDETAFTLASALLGRVHLSGRIDLLRPAQSELTAEALAAYRVLRPHLKSARPHWPLGLPAWRDGWVALALESEFSGPAAHVLVWRRDGEDAEIRLPMPWLRDRRGLDARIVFPASSEAVVAWEQESRTLNVELPQPWSAVLLSVNS